MFRQLKIPVLGLVENMSFYACPSCGNRDDVFGHGGAEAWAEKQGIPFLGAIPLHTQVRVGGDAGVPALARPRDAEGRSRRFALRRERTRPPGQHPQPVEARDRGALEITR